VLVQVIFTRGEIGYDLWAGIFNPHSGCVRSPSPSFLALTYHVWVGMRDIWMDYIKPVGIRLASANFHYGLVAVLHGLGSSGSLETLIDDTLFSSPPPL
jgi:succinate dehydrogenase hydrophobic membrane anchor protein